MTVPAAVVDKDQLLLCVLQTAQASGPDMGKSKGKRDSLWSHGPLWPSIVQAKPEQRTHPSHDQCEEGTGPSPAVVVGFG